MGAPVLRNSPDAMKTPRIGLNGNDTQVRGARDQKFQGGNLRPPGR